MKSSLRKCNGRHNDVVNCYGIFMWQWPPICSICHKHFPVISSFMTYYRVCNYINTLGATSGAGSTYPSGAPEFTPVFSGTRVARPLVLYVCFLDRWFSFCTFSFRHCGVCSLIYGWWLPFWYLQTLLSKVIELLKISSANIWKLSGLQLKYILIQQELIFIEKDRTNIPERTTVFILTEFKFEHWQRGQ